MATAEAMVLASDREERAMVHGGAGTLAMAMMPEAEFDQRLRALQKGAERIKTIKRELMQIGVHYGVIPGTDKPALLKPGAEVLCSIYGLRADFLPRIEYGDGVLSPPIRVSMRCELHLGDLAGPVVAVGYGSASSWERKHRYRRGERSCPECGVVGSVIKGKADFGGGFLCWAKKGGCGAKFNENDDRIRGQAVGDVENPDQHDLENTLVKMAKKRAHVDAALTGTASSDLFTQDVDEDHPQNAPQPNPAARPAPQAAQPEREPGDDEGPDPYEDAGVEAPRHSPRPAPAKAAPATNSGGASAQCPHCGKSARPSKFPKEGKTHYCYDCKHPFAPEA